MGGEGVWEPDSDVFFDQLFHGFNCEKYLYFLFYFYESEGNDVYFYYSEGSDIAHRLIECQYELTDTLAYYLCQRKPDHRNGQHFIIPEMSDSMDVTELAKAARKKLQAVSY